MKNSIKWFLFLFFISTSLYASSEAHESHGPNLAFVFKTINFLILCALLYFLLRRPIADYFRARAHAIKQSVEEARQVHLEALNENKKIVSKLENIEKEADKLISSFKEEGESERKKVVDQAHFVAKKIIEDSKKVAESELKKAKNELKEEAIRLSKELAEKSIQQGLTKNDEEHLVESYLKECERLK